MANFKISKIVKIIQKSGSKLLHNYQRFTY